MAVLQRLDVHPVDRDGRGGQRHRAQNRREDGVQMGRRFWEEDEGIFGGHLWSRSLQVGELSYPSKHCFSKKGVLLGFYGNGGLAGLSDVSIEARVRHVITQASKVHPQMREALESAFAVWWEKFPYSLGAYGRTPAPRLLAQLSKPDGRFYLGCAGVSQRPAWIEGGIHAAWRTVEALHECAMRA